MKERLEQRNGKAVAVAVENSARNITPNAPLTPHAIAPVTLSLPNVAKGKFRPNIQISFSKILTGK